jgi:uncharacterized protein (TIGR02611 family)
MAGDEGPGRGVPDGPVAGPFGERLRGAAIEAELETGRREQTIGQVRRSILRRVARMTAGSFLLLVGLAMLVLPGPGWLVIAAGLAVLARDVAWAERLLARVRRRIPGARPDGRLTPAAWASVALVTLAATSASVWFMVR